MRVCVHTGSLGWDEEGRAFLAGVVAAGGFFAGARGRLWGGPLIVGCW